METIINLSLAILIFVLLAASMTLVYFVIIRHTLRFYDTERANGFHPAMVCLVVILVIVLCVSGIYEIEDLLECITAEPEVNLLSTITTLRARIIENIETFFVSYSFMTSAGNLVSLAVCEMEWRTKNKKKEETQ